MSEAKSDELSRSLKQITQECFCLSSRMTARAVTRRYNAVLAPLDLEVTEFSLLGVLAAGKDGSIAELAERLAFERTTLVRNLKRMADRGLIAPADKKGRAVRYVPTPEGHKLLRQALPLWTKAQAELQKHLDTDAGEARDVLTDLRQAAQSTD